jgi:hypothetical protein
MTEQFQISPEEARRLARKHPGIVDPHEFEMYVRMLTILLNTLDDERRAFYYEWDELALRKSRGETLTAEEREKLKRGNAEFLPLIERITFELMERKRHVWGGLAMIAKFIIGLFIIAGVLWTIFT